MVSSTPAADYIVTDRGGIIENRYSVHCAVVDQTGRILSTCGDPNRLTLARSAAKPAQALAVLETEGFDMYGFDDVDLALVCASHSSEERHVQRARSMLARVGAEEHHLRCGGHPSISDEVNQGWIKAGLTPTGVYNNCSGKHAGMLGGAKALRAEFKGYELPDHPMQRWVKETFEYTCGMSPDEVKWAIDGCNLPAPACPLYGLANVYAFFAEAPDATEKTPRIEATNRIFSAMATHPEQVGGKGRFCTDLMSAFAGSLISKVGADGCYGVGVRASDETRKLDADGAIGIAVKIEDGNRNILYSAVVEILEQLDLGNEEMRGKLDKYHAQEIKNTMGIVTGHVAHPFRLRPS
ncbi:hypothetical protein B9Z65_3435 [Elsinoe australis]|uniref:L-asparaginase II n=1 Tax=Elsinoe australis TaxID=40998 RepID=A0A2P8A1K0_9PEZI|nr:hypothetical protein B9Z65_3435 [Elsinoe australis]